MRTLTLTIKAVFDDEEKLLVKESDINSEMWWASFSLDNFSKALDFWTTVILWSAVDESIKSWLETNMVSRFFAKYTAHLLESFALLTKKFEEEYWSTKTSESKIQDLIDEVNNQ